jgi:fluoroquinolone resistance protein
LNYKKEFINKNINEIELDDKELEQCIFKNCDLSNVSFVGFNFIEVLFEDCNLSLIKIDNAFLQNVTFKNCKLSGIIFDNCKDFGLALRFENCVLDYTSFAKKKLVGTHFIDCKIKEGNFDQSDLKKSVFANCDLLNTSFTNNDLTHCDFSTAHNFLIDPASNQIKKAKFSRQELAGLLFRHEIIIT